ncbi:MAG TPA: LemA family protein [Candidatus Dormibacteraeota bacterium]|nr:LemA family protein [Candidatus Dormibacteraeota bacterium]
MPIVHKARLTAVLGLGIFIGLVFSFRGFRVYRGFHVEEDIPEIPVRRAAMGLVHVHGSAYARARSIPEKTRADARLTGALRGLFAVAKKYPELKADANFLNGEQRITPLEEEIADRREFFNDSVNTCNIRIRQLPDLFVAMLPGMEPEPLFQATGKDRQDVKVELA